MPTDIQNLIIFGDSLSDIGIKKSTGWGRIARLMQKMRVNEVGRYSDGRNWTDFLVEWMGSESLFDTDAKTTISRTNAYRSLTNESFLIGANRSGGSPVRYANLAAGGAIAGDDWKPKFGALGHISGQVDEYIKARKATPNWTGNTLHVIWIGLNDIVTAKRPEGLTVAQMAQPFDNPVTKQNARDADLATRIPEREKAGLYAEGRDDATLIDSRIPDEAGRGMSPLAASIFTCLERIEEAFPGTREHFVLVNLPSPLISIRFLNMVEDDGDTAVAKVNLLKANVLRFNELLTALVKAGSNRMLVDMYGWLETVSTHLKEFDLLNGSQPHEMAVAYGPKDPDAQLRRYLTTSDKAHPTEAVYQLIARKIVEDLMPAYTLGKLDRASWEGLRPRAQVKV